jgi:hypothetical protein
MGGMLMDILESTIVRAILVGMVVIVWWTMHTLHKQSFLLKQWAKLHDSLVRLNRDTAAEINADLIRELRESKHFIPYIFAIRKFSDAPGLAETKDCAALNIDTIKERLHPGEVNRDYEWRLRIETENRGRMLQQDLYREIPQFKHQMQQISRTHEHQRWLAAQDEISRLRQAILGAQAEIRNNPAIAAQLGEVMSAMYEFDHTMVKARDEGTVPDSAFGEMMDKWMTGVFQKHLEDRFGVKAA